MNRKQFGILIVLLLVLGGAGLWLQRNRNHEASAGETGAGQNVLGDNFPYNDVAHIRLKHEADEVNLVNTNNTWCVVERDDYPANFTQISDLLLKAKDMKAVQVVEVGASQLYRLGLAPPGQGTNSGLVIDFIGKDGKPIQSLVLGKKHLAKPQPTSYLGESAEPDGRYVMAGSASANAVLIGDPLDEVEPKPATWLNKTFFKVERPKSIAVTYPNASTNSWKIYRDLETGDWKLADAQPGETLDSSKAAGLENPFVSPEFNDVVPANVKPSEDGLDQPTVMTIGTFDGITFTLSIGRNNGSEYPVTLSVAEDLLAERTPAADEKPADKSKLDQAFQEQRKQLDEKFAQAKAFENRTFLLSNWSVDQYLKQRKDILQEKKAEKPADKELIDADSIK